MNFSFAPPEPLAYFDSLVQSDAGFPLLEAAAALGHMQDPELDVQAVLSEHDAWTARLRARLPADASPLPLACVEPLFLPRAGLCRQH